MFPFINIKWAGLTIKAFNNSKSCNQPSPNLDLNNMLLGFFLSLDYQVYQHISCIVLIKFTHLCSSLLRYEHICVRVPFHIKFE